MGKATAECLASKLLCYWFFVHAGSRGVRFLFLRRQTLRVGSFVVSIAWSFCFILRINNPAAFNLVHGVWGTTRSSYLWVLESMLLFVVYCCCCYLWHGACRCCCPPPSLPFEPVTASKVFSLCQDISIFACVPFYDSVRTYVVWGVFHRRCFLLLPCLSPACFPHDSIHRALVTTTRTPIQDRI